MVLEVSLPVVGSVEAVVWVVVEDSGFDEHLEDGEKVSCKNLKYTVVILIWSDVLLYTPYRAWIPCLSSRGS